MRCLESDGEAGSAQRSEAPSEERARKGPTPGEGAESTLPGGTPKKKKEILKKLTGKRAGRWPF
ncbi:hypothetical protein [Thermaurantimonas aggregans]|uniref:hypothetical protein n=1 Tax=Thermaurantimonas aggregans TaxID=2173829 RepID=UPI000F58CFB2|nr:hypothetical protein [Thermaurantimonas aggregans]MCX8149349.1 hypothetical protein [Thermaurantimonas aggregans]